MPPRVSLYELFLFLHVTAAIIWLGAGLALTLLAVRAQQANDRAAKAALNAQNEWLAPRLFIPSSISTFVFGVLLVAEGSWDLGQLWIVLGLAGWLVSFVTGFFYFKPESERIIALVEAHGPAHREVQRRFDQMEAVARVELTLLFLVVADMVIKPTGDDVGVLLAGAAILALTAAVVFAGLRSGSRQLTQSA